MKIKTWLIIAFLLSFQLAKGQTWSELCSHGDSLKADSSINSIVSDAVGNIYAAGQFTNSSGNKYVAKFNGTTWSEVGGLNGLIANNTIVSLCSDAAGNIYAAGQFTNSSGNKYVAKFNGTTWSELGGLNGLAANGRISSICIDATGNIYAAGGFTNDSGKCYVAKWNGTTWSEVGGNNSLAPNSVILSICSDAASNIYAAGSFTDHTGAYYVAKYNGTTWSELGGVRSLFFANDLQSILVNGNGNIDVAGNSIYGDNIFEWDGTKWKLLDSSGFLGNSILPIYRICSDLAGNIYSIKSNLSIAKLKGSTWSELSGLAVNHWINSICSDAAGNIYAAGTFTNGSSATNGNFYVAKYTTPTGISTLTTNPSPLSISPNPTNSQSTVISSQSLVNASIKLINLTGQTVMEKQNQSGNQFSIDLSKQSAGIYFVEVQQNGEVWRGKVVKQ